MVWLFVAPSNWVFWLAVNMRDFEKLPIWEHSVEWNMRIGVIISDEPRINDEIRVSQVRLIGLEEYGTVEFAPKQEGRNIIMTLAPKGKKVHTQSEQRRRGDQSRAERQARQAARLAAKQEAQAQAAAEAKAAVASDKPKTSETK